MDAISQSLWDPVSTLTAFLRCAVGRHAHNRGSSFLGLVFQETYELAPGGIMYALGKGSAREAAEAVFDGNERVLADQAPADLMVIVSAGISQLLKSPGEQSSVPLEIVAAGLLAMEPALKRVQA